MVTTYSAVSTTLAYAVGWTDVFTNSGENLGCPITTCTLRTADCSAVATVNTNFYMASASPWGLSPVDMSKYPAEAHIAVGYYEPEWS